VATTLKKKSKSVLKRERQIKKKTSYNRSIKREIKTWMKKVKTALQAGNIEEAKKNMNILNSKLDKAVKKGVIHKNNASNKKSTLMSLIAKKSKQSVN